MCLCCFDIRIVGLGIVFGFWWFERGEDGMVEDVGFYWFVFRLLLEEIRNGVLINVYNVVVC